MIFRVVAASASLALVAALAACGGDGTAGAGGGGNGGSGGAAPTDTELVFDLGADLHDPAHFYDAPYPSDLRLTAQGTPDLTGMPYPKLFTLFDQLRQVAMEHTAFPTVPVAHFKFTGAMPRQDPDKLIAPSPSTGILLIDVDPTSDERGTLFATAASTPEVDAYTPAHVLSVAAWPGIVLHPNRTYAFVVLRSLGDAKGKPLGVVSTIADLVAGKTPAGASGAAAKKVFSPLIAALSKAKVDPADVAAATVFTTGDVVQDLADLSSKLIAKYSVTIDGLHVDPDDGADHDRYCELKGTMKLPQFQKGKPPFDTEGLFEFGADGLPKKQRDEVAPLTLTIPKGEMPANGFPLVLFFHGSGGLSTAVVDRGRWTPQDPANCPGCTCDEWMGTMGCNAKGEGPAYVLAPFGFAAAGSALPVNPERLPGANETAYLNFNNLAEGRDLFRQGVIEQRLFLDALAKLKIDPATLGACTGISLPPGATQYGFDDSHVFAQGQSMGGQYTNMVSAVEPRVLASVPTGAGGYWSHFVMHTPLIPNLPGKVGTVLLGTQAKLSFLHPALAIFETVWEPVDPMVYMPRLGRRPLPGHPVRPVYEPAAIGDSYFPTVTYDAMATSYGNREAGKQVWKSMQTSLALDGLDGILDFPVKDDVESADGSKYTGVMVQYHGDGVYDPHAIYSQLDAVKYQYGCFLSTMLATGTATVPAPAPLGTPCPQ